MATGREYTPEDRLELVDEARELARVAESAPGEPFEPHGTSSDALVASLATRAGVDGIVPVGRMQRVKRGMLKMSQAFLRDQADFNRLAVTTLEDVTARLEAIESRLASLETQREPVRPTEE